jgi:hypothetical protein
MPYPFSHANRSKTNQFRYVVFYYTIVLVDESVERLVLGDFDFTSVNGITNILGVLAINSAANGEGSTQNLLDGALELTSKRLVAHDASNLNNIIDGDVARVLDYNDTWHIFS